MNITKRGVGPSVDSGFWAYEITGGAFIVS